MDITFVIFATDPVDPIGQKDLLALMDTIESKTQRV